MVGIDNESLKRAIEEAAVDMEGSHYIPNETEKYVAGKPFAMLIAIVLAGVSGGIVEKVLRGGGNVPKAKIKKAEAFEPASLYQIYPTINNESTCGEAEPTLKEESDEVSDEGVSEPIPVKDQPAIPRPEEKPAIPRPKEKPGSKEKEVKPKKEKKPSQGKGPYMMA